MELHEIRPGVWRWVAAHPEWRPGAKPESPADWPEEVGSVVARVPGGVVFIDALAPEGGGEALWAQLDGLVAGAEHVWALTTIKFHRRSRDAFVARYDASTSRARSSLPDGIEAIPIHGAGETMFWLADQRTLVCGDRIVGDRRGGLRLCPESWLGYLGRGMDLAGLREALMPLLELPVAAVIVSHGDPVLEGASGALRYAIRGK